MHRKIIGLHRFINKGDVLQVGKKQKRNRAELYSLLLLAGGKSSRMGEDKAGLLLNGESFLSCQIKKAEKKQKRNRAELYSLLLLAGGKSSRMGEDKAGLLLNGESFLSCQIKKAEKLGIREVYVSGHNVGECVFRNENGRFMFPVIMLENVSSGTKK